MTEELQSAYPRLLSELRERLGEELRGPGARLRDSLSARAREIEGKVLDPRVARLVVALAADIPGDDEWTEYVALNVAGTPAAAWTDDDRSGFMTVIRELGGTFRRIEALNADLRSQNGPFEALRVTVTRPDGSEIAKLVWVDDDRRQLVANGLQDLLGRLDGQLGRSQSEVRDVLLALLAEEEVEPPSTFSSSSESNAASRMTGRKRGAGR